VLFNCGVNIKIFCDNKDAVYIWVNQSVFVNKKLSFCQETMIAMRNVNSNINANRNPYRAVCRNAARRAGSSAKAELVVHTL